MNTIARRLLSNSVSSGGKIKVELMFDIVSPYSYLQFEQLCRLRKDWTKMDLHFEPVFAYGVITGSGNQVTATVCPNKTTWSIKDLDIIAKHHKVTSRLSLYLSSLIKSFFVFFLDSVRNSRKFSRNLTRLW